MEHEAANDEVQCASEVLAEAPEELTRAPLRRLGEGIGKVVYASEHWVVKRERSTSAVLALIIIWKFIRKIEHLLPAGVGLRMLRHPSRQLRLLRVLIQACMVVIPRSIWFMSHVGQVWRVYRKRDRRGERLAERHLAGTSLVPDRISFPPTRVRVGGWPGWLTVDEATERVEATLHQRLSDLARAGKFDEVEVWLDRLLDLRRAGWQRGIFSIDAHFKNFGVTQDRVVLLDPGGLTNRWHEVENRLRFEDVSPPHRRLGLAPILASHPEIADSFDARWRAAVNIDEVRSHWPVDPAAA
jgi:hypothetical protein